MEQWNIFDLNKIEGQDETHGIYGGKFAPLGQQIQSEKLGFNITTINPGLFFCPHHLHHHEEELMLVLEGEVTVRQGEETKILHKGEMIFFKTHTAHQMYNHNNTPVKILAISNKDPHDVCEYPDSKKIYFRKLKKIYKQGTEMAYMDGEHDIADFWKGKI